MRADAARNGGVLPAIAAAALLLQTPATAQSVPGTRVEVIRLMYADARDIAVALGALRPPDLQAAVAYVPNNQLITGWGPGALGTSGFVSGAFGSPFGSAFGNGFGQRQGGAPPEAMPLGGTPPPAPQAVR